MKGHEMDRDALIQELAEERAEAAIANETCERLRSALQCAIDDLDRLKEQLQRALDDSEA